MVESSPLSCLSADNVALPAFAAVRRAAAALAGRGD